MTISERPDTSVATPSLDNALVERSTSFLSTASDLDTSFTSFEEILKQDTSRVWTPSESAHSRTDSTSDILWESQAFLMRSTKNMNSYSETVRAKGEEYAKVAQTEAAKCSAAAKERVQECVEDFFSPAQQQARARVARKTLSFIRMGLGACHDTVDSLLVQIFDQPLREVEVRSELAQADGMSVNESLTDELTIDSALVKRAFDESMPSERNMFLVPSNSLSAEEGTRDTTSTPSTSDDENDITLTPQRDEAEDLLDSTSISERLRRAPSTESDAESLRRFKEELYKGHHEKSTIASRDTIETPRDQSTTLVSSETEEKEEASAKEERVDWTDVEDMDQVIENKLMNIEQDIHTNETPQRGNRRSHQELDFVDLSGIGQSTSFDPTVAATVQQSEKLRHNTPGKTPLDPYVVPEHIDCTEIEERDASDSYHNCDRLVEPVIDLTMYGDL